MDGTRRAALRGRRNELTAPHLTCAGCGSTARVAGAHGWQPLLGADLAPAAFCPRCARPELRRFIAEHRAERSLARSSHA